MEKLELNTPQNIALRFRINTISSYWPIWMLASRTILFALVQGLFVIVFGLSLTESAVWWPVSAIIANMICFLLLRMLVIKEGISYLDLIHFDRKKIKQDVKSSFIVLFVGIVIGFGGIYGVSFLMYGDAVPNGAMVQPLPIWAAIIGLLVWPITNALVETPTYMGYCLPRLEVRMKSRFAALTLSALFLAIQHITLPLTTDLKFMIWHAVCMIPLAFTVGVLYLKLRRLVPIMIVHYIMDVMAVMGVFITSLNV